MQRKRRNTGARTSNKKTQKHRDYWSQDIAKIIKQMHGSQTKQDSNANKLISSALDVIFSKIIEKMKENNPENPTVEDIGKAIKELMSPSLALHAISEGTRETFLFEVTPFHFVPNRRRTLKADDKFHKMIENIKKKEATELNRSYISGVMALAKDYHPDSRLGKESKNYVCTLLDNITNEIVEKIKESNPEILTLKGAQSVINDVLPPDLSRHARSEGNKMMYKFESRGLDFVPGSSIRLKIQEMTSAYEDAKGSRKKLEADGTEFQNGVMSILKDAHPKADLDPKALKNICHQLESLYILIFQEIGEKRGIKNYEDVHRAVQKLLPPLMAQHAAAEGHKMLDQQAIGHFGFGRASQWETDIVPGLDKELESGVLDITNEYYPQAKLDRMVQNRIPFGLNRLFDALVDKMKESGTSDVAPANVLQAVEAVFGQSSLAEHAKSEGGKWVALAEMGANRLWRVAERAVLDAESS